MFALSQIFQYNGSQVRTIVKDGEPWFVAKDVCDILGLTNPSESLKSLDGDEKSTLRISEGGPEANIINEPGLYSLVIRSNKPESKAFKRWITHEVIPTIRKHGIYATDQAIEKTHQDPDYLIGVLQALKAEREKRKVLELENAQNKQIISELQPKASYYDLILQNKSLVPISKIAKDYGMSATAMNRLLHELGVQYKLGDTWLLYQKYAGQGYTQSKTHAVDADKSVMHTCWTQKGRIFLYQHLKSCRGLLPLIEREKSA